MFLNNRINGNSPSHISYGSSDVTTPDFNGDHNGMSELNGLVKV